MNIYVTSNIFGDEPTAVKQVPYTHVKCKSNGSQTLILTDSNITDPDVSLLTIEDAQTLLDSWIDEENSGNPVDFDGNPKMQKHINLLSFLEEV